MRYTGANPVDAAQPAGPGEYRNPILPGFQPDPSIVRVGRDYYIVNSSFAFYPGLPIFHSRDLVTWRQIGNAIDRPGMFDFTGLGIARAIFAPTIRHHAGLFYIFNTCIECGFNFVITAKDPRGPWSKPVFLPEIDGIDLDLFVDKDGRAWVTNNGPPAGTPRYDGHRALWIQEFDLKALRLVGPRRVIVDGGVHPAENPIWTEGPHIVLRGGWYYLLAAEGGTAGQHAQTVYRSRHVTGPYAPGPINPILTQRDLNPARAFPVYAAGHADLVQTPGGAWWAVFLATRPYAANLSNMGRETFLLPVRWAENGWPLILPAKTVVPQVAARPRLPRDPAVEWGAWREKFSARRLAPDWLMLRTPKTRWFHTGPGGIRLDPRADTLSGLGNPSFLARRQRHATARIETALRFRPQTPGDRAGLALFADEQHHLFFGLDQAASGARLIVARRAGKNEPEGGSPVAARPFARPPGSTIRLRVTLKGPVARFDYALADGGWQILARDVDAHLLASERSNQFTGSVMGIYAASGPPR